MKSEIVKILMERDGATREEAEERLSDARKRVQLEGEDPGEILNDEFELEPDYLFELMD